MLHLNTIYPKTLELLRLLQSISEFKNLRLVGGTALALQIGHRISEDIDLFGVVEMEEGFLFDALKNEYKITNLKNSKNINIFNINSIKVDIVNYPYSWLENALIEESIIMANKTDIAAMKLAAITGRGTRKDFIDIYFLLHYFTLNQMLGYYMQKFPDGSEFLVLRSLSYFDDADKSEELAMIEPINWNHVKETIKTEIRKIA